MTQDYQDDCLLLFRKISEMLNSEIRRSGQLELNNKTIWSALNSMDNEIWHMYLTAIKIIDKEFGHLVMIDEIATVLELERALERHGHQSDNLLTPHKTRAAPHNYKGRAWKMINQGREIWCRANNIDLPNADTSKAKPGANLLSFN